MDTILSIGLSFAPIIGDAKDFQEAVTGWDYVTKQKLSGWDRVLTAGSAIVPVVSGASLRGAIKTAKQVDGPVGAAVGAPLKTGHVVQEAVKSVEGVAEVAVGTKGIS